MQKSRSVTNRAHTKKVKMTNKKNEPLWKMGLKKIAIKKKKINKERQHYASDLTFFSFLSFLSTITIF